MRILTGHVVFRSRLWLAAVAVLVQCSAWAQPASQRLDGEFARRSLPDTPRVAKSNESVIEKASGLRATGVTLKELIAMGYPVVLSQIAGGPEWMDTETFDVSVIPHPGEASREQAVRRFLKTHFSLAVHSDTAPVFMLSVSQRGPKLTPTALDSSHRSSFDAEPGKIVGHGATLKQLTAELAKYLHRPVLDHTRLLGTYDYTLKWRAGRATVADGKGDSALEAALRSDLGLELSSFPYQSLVVDRAELPTD